MNILNIEGDQLPLLYIVTGNVCVGKTHSINQLISHMINNQKLNYGIVFTENNNYYDFHTNNERVFDQLNEEKLALFVDELKKNNVLMPYLVIDTSAPVDWFMPTLHHLIMNRERYNLTIFISAISIHDVDQYVRSMCNGLVHY